MTNLYSLSLTERPRNGPLSHLSWQEGFSLHVLLFSLTSLLLKQYLTHLKLHETRGCPLHVGTSKTLPLHHFYVCTHRNLRSTITFHDPLGPHSSRTHLLLFSTPHSYFRTACDCKVPVVSSYNLICWRFHRVLWWRSVRPKTHQSGRVWHSHNRTVCSPHLHYRTVRTLM